MQHPGHIPGTSLRRPFHTEVDVVVVGSGPAGATVAWELTQAGAKVAVVEAGPWRQPASFPLGGFEAMADMYRDMGASLVVGPALMPYVQGRMVGGSSPINGAICWRMPHDVHRAWCMADPALTQALPWETLERITDRLEARLHIRPTDPAVAGLKNQLLARGAEALGLEHRPTRRNVHGCEGLGRCLQGCPRGHKRSMDMTLLHDALQMGATLMSDTEVKHLTIEQGQAVGVEALAEGGGQVRLRARRAVVLAASAVQTPALLLRSGLHQGPVGAHFQCHPGVSVAGRFKEPVRMWDG
ncbi:MAG: FAD-dependent oxidoreductase, partial [Myxococcota bacterium]